MQKMKVNAAREARVKLNQMINKETKIDYLTNQKEVRKIKMQPSEEFNWEEILRKSLMR